MEYKRKKLDCDFNQDMAVKDETEVKQLFKKEFCYEKSSGWTLETTSLFRNLKKKNELQSCLGLCKSATVVNKTAYQDTPELSSHESFSSSCLAKDCLTMKDVPLSGSVKCAYCKEQHTRIELGGKLKTEIDAGMHTDCWDKRQPVHSSFDECDKESIHEHHRCLEDISEPSHAGVSQKGSSYKHRQVGGCVCLLLPESWQHQKLIEMKDTLNSLKDRLSDKEMVAWHQHTTSTNLAGKIVNTVKQHFHVELCTQAWCKFHEMLARYDIVPQTVLSSPCAEYSTVHLCEAPGAFITSLNHFLVSRDFRGTWHWLGTTLNPYYEGNGNIQMINDDRFIRNTFDKWYFGEDNSGDLMTEQNLKALQTKVATGGDVHLVTADGSINCQENPAEQEKLVSRLHLCEALTACLLLAPTGHLVIKLFTMFESSTICLLYFLNCAFQKVTICKPATSKSGNSEVYAICSGYLLPLPNDQLLAIFSAICRSTDKDAVLFTQEDIPQDFLDQHTACCQYFCRLQAETISRNLELYNQMDYTEQEQLGRLQDSCVEHYIQLCQLKPIKTGQKIATSSRKGRFYRFSALHYSTNGLCSSTHSQQRRDLGNVRQFSGSDFPGRCPTPAGRMQGTFRQRQEQHKVTWPQLLEQISEHSIEEYDILYVTCHEQLDAGEVTEWHLLKGRPLAQVSSSQFCDGRILENWKLLMLHSKVPSHQQLYLQQYAAKIKDHVLEIFYAACQNFCKDGKAHHLLCHLALEGSVMSLVCEDFQAMPHQEHVKLDSLDRLRNVAEDAVCLFVDITWPDQLGSEEFSCIRRLLLVVSGISRHLRAGSSVMLLMPVALTRLPAGLLYLLARMFGRTRSKMLPQSPFTHQLLHFQDFWGAPNTVLQHLESLQQIMKPEPRHKPTGLGASPLLQVSLPENTCVTNRNDSGDASCSIPMVTSHGSQEESGCSCQRLLLGDEACIDPLTCAQEPSLTNAAAAPGVETCEGPLVNDPTQEETTVTKGGNIVHDFKNNSPVSLGNFNRQSCFMPLEVVPIFRILNDGGFCRLLQVSNMNSMMKFINCIKKEELQLLKPSP